MFNKEIPFVKTFESYITYAVYEKSTLNKIDLPQEMIKLLHTKEEHLSDKYPIVGHMYRGSVAVPLPHKFHALSAKTPLPEPIRLTGRDEIGSPFSLDTDSLGGGREKTYTDLIWFLRSIPYGECRVLIAHPESEFYMFIYGKMKSVGATGSQYAVISWHPRLKKAIDYGFSELTTQGVDEDELRGVHSGKGGNTVGKVQEHIKSRIPGYQSKKATVAIQAYVFEVAPSQEAKIKRETRKETKGETTSSEFLKYFADKFSKITPKLKVEIQSKFVNDIDSSSRGYNSISPEITALANTLGAGPAETATWLYKKFRDFRKELFEEGRGRTQGAKSAYEKTAGIELEQENMETPSWESRYQVRNEKFDPTTKYDITKSIDPDQPSEDETADEKKIRLAQPEKYKTVLPIAGEYASIPSMIRKHKLEGIINKFIAFLATDKIKLADISLEGILGIQSDEGENKFKRSSRLSTNEPESDNLLF